MNGLSFLAGLYGYIAFVLVLLTAKNAMQGKDFFWSKIRKYTDALVGVLSFIISTQAEGKFKIILILYGASLLLSSLKDVLKVSNVVIKKVFNYITNSYIVLAIFLMAPVVEETLHVNATIIFILIYFLTYKLIWRGLR